MRQLGWTVTLFVLSVLVLFFALVLLVQVTTPMVAPTWRTMWL